MKLADLKIATRLYAGFAAVIVVLLIMVVIAYRNFAALGVANDMNIHTYQVMAQTKAMLESLINIETGQRGFSLTGNDASLEPLNNGRRSFAEHLAATRSLTSDNPAQQDRLAKLEQSQQQWLRDAIEPALAQRRAVIAGTAAIDSVVALEQQGKGKTAMDAMRALLADLGAAEEALLKERAAQAAALQSQSSTVLIGGGLLAAAIAAVMAWILSQNITRPLGEAVGLAQRVAGGDLTARIDATSADETGALMAALRDMNAGLAAIVTQVREGTDTIATASREIATGNLDLSARTEQQAGALEETASSMEELTSTVKQNADNARTASQMAGAATQVAAQGGAVVGQVVQTMAQINASAQRIVDIITVIDGIAFQTNILALNAAVEAARAGEQGRGFAVVAGEVRNLAQRAAAAAREIKELIGDSVEKVNAGTALVDQAGATMQQVVSSIRDVGTIIADISSASEEQRAGIEQVNAAITQMDNVTQQNAALVEQASAAASAMQEQATRLADVVKVFTVAGGAPTASASRAMVPRLGA
ncbi:methyl-accepting chemotaxis protein [Pseudoduganella armeniaca]|uniref:Chemotaxis protein n=1 Tax=Pseudoduganella armeniaca TaxID=2072590 RepID=A0A2R4C9G5_9BURK|nr:methyl-accepting chemotaxis protein [Pseudoduganella armeniaca]AVR96233.1 chemotaxis protein [Pseudoduganella armeniaca]